MRIIYSHEFYHSSLYCIIAALNENIRVFNLCKESRNLHNLYFIAHMCLCILFLSEQQKRCTKLNQVCLFLFFFYLTSSHTHILPTSFYFRLTDELGRTGRKGTTIHVLSFPFLSYHYQPIRLYRIR